MSTSLQSELSSGEEPAVSDIDQLFQIGDREVNLYGMKELVLLIGGTGTGKSTLSKFLRKDPTLKIIENKADELIFSDGEIKIGSKNSHRSKTLFPYWKKDELSGALLVDCAGFEDTRHQMYDLLASFFTQKVFNAAEKMKIVFVESFERMRLSSDRTSFLRSIKQLAQLLQDDVAAFHDSIGLVATKAESAKSDEQLVKSVQEFLKETIETLQTKQKELECRGESMAAKELEKQILLVQFLASGGNVTIFRRPDDQQIPWTLPPVQKNFKQIRDMIFIKMKYLDTRSHRFKASVAPETSIYIQNDVLGPAKEKLKGILEQVVNLLIIEFNIKIAEISSQYLSQCLNNRIEFCQNYLKEFSEIKATTSLFDFFKAHSVDQSLIAAANIETRKIVFFETVVRSDIDIEILQDKIANIFGLGAAVLRQIEISEKFYSFVKSLIEHSGKYEIYVNNEPFYTKVTSETYINFISHLMVCGINSESVHDATDLKPSVDQLKFLNRVRSERLVTVTTKEKRENFVGYSGRYILASQIESPRDIKGQLLITANHKFFIDCDLELIDAHLTIIAPIVEVVGSDRKITLRGSNGMASQFEADEGMNGSHGQPGNVSGDFYVFALNVTNSQSLRIDSVGGEWTRRWKGQRRPEVRAT